jgi:magnesium chelatase accessory protein
MQNGSARPLMLHWAAKPMDWSRDLSDWPLNRVSRRITCKPHQWHVQEDGSGNTLLLLHGAGATTHTWRDILPELARTYHVVALDLPGQGFTRLGSRGRCSLPHMTSDILSLCKAEGWRPKAIIGHSAGAAIALSIADSIAQTGENPPAIIGINAALGRFDGVASWLFPLLAKLLALNPLTAHAFTLGGNHMARARRLIESTGSQISEEGLALYARLIADRGHVDGTLQMMSQWNTDVLNRRFAEIGAPCLLMAGDADKAVAPKISKDAAGKLGNAVYVPLPELGHLAHEENPETVLAHIRSWLGAL